MVYILLVILTSLYYVPSNWLEMSFCRYIKQLINGEKLANKYRVG